MALSVERSNDVAHGDEIKALFLRNDRPAFPEQFDLVYPPSYGSGGASWIARDGEGRAVGHIAVFPRELRSADARRRVMVFGDLMMDSEHRDFFSAVKLAKAATTYLRTERPAEFAYAFSIDVASGVLRGAGLKRVAEFRRYVMPLAAPYRLFTRLRSHSARLDAEHFVAPWESAVGEALDAIAPDSFVRGDRAVSRYAPHLGRESFVDWHWFVFRPRGRGARTPIALALGATVAQRRALMLHDLVWNDGVVDGATVLHAVAAAAATIGCAKLSTSVLAPSRFCGIMERCGFVRRADALAFLTLEIPGIASPDQDAMLLTTMDGTTW